MDILSVTKDYVECASNGAVTAPYNGSWISAYAIHLGATGPVNGSWLQALCAQLGITQPVNNSWIIALANYYGISNPVNGTWWYAIADDACNGGTPPTADFIGSPLTLNEGSSVTYTDLSTDNGGPAITSWSWTFEGGTPATSSLQNPVIQYNTAGTYNTSLTVSNADGSDGELKEDYIQVNVAPTPIVINGFYAGIYGNKIDGNYTGGFANGAYANKID